MEGEKQIQPNDQEGQNLSPEQSWEGYSDILERGRDLSRQFKKRITEVRDQRRRHKKELTVIFWTEERKVVEEEIIKNDEEIERLKREQQEVEDDIKKELKKYHNKNAI